MTSPSADLPVLYSFRRCPYAMRARLALLRAGQRCELREVVLRDKPQAMIDASAKATVPVLVDVQGAVIDQSLDIMLWALRRRDPDSWLAPATDGLAQMIALIAQCDDDFKPDLDRYKYPQRFDLGDGGANRDQAGTWLASLNTRLAGAAFLFGPRASLADAAIFPFVRQFAHVDTDWFANQPWPALQAWLDGWLACDIFVRAMRKYPPWVPGTTGPVFPCDDNPAR